jgi:SWI/SNF-related matrix-associated actin-dependent regulator 1 of chromatin subfamily A
VADDFPKKIEHIQLCGLTGLQRLIYDDATHPGMPNGSAAPGHRKQGKKLMNQRKACLHPLLFRWRFTDRILVRVANIFLTHPDFENRGALFEDLMEDMTVMTDAELQLLFAKYEVCTGLF